MPKVSPQLDWCIVRLGEDMNWWISEISDPVHWDVDGLGILDPRQIDHIVEVCEGLREYGFDAEILDRAFFTFAIDKEIGNGVVRLTRVRESLLEGEDRMFALPDILDEDKGPYAEFLDRITRCRVKMLNDLIEFESKLTVDELEEEIRERQTAHYYEGRALHFFTEVTAILEFIPNGYELDVDEEARPATAPEEDFADLPDIEVEEEKIEEDETMRWDEEEKEPAEEDELADGFSKIDDEPPPGTENLDDLEDDEDEEEEDDEEDSEDDEEDDDEEDGDSKRARKKSKSSPKSKSLPKSKSSPKSLSKSKSPPKSKPSPVKVKAKTKTKAGKKR